MDKRLIMSRAYAPAEYLSGFEIKDGSDVYVRTLICDVSEVLHPTTRINHTGVTLAILRPIRILKVYVRLQGIGWH